MGAANTKTARQRKLKSADYEEAAAIPNAAVFVGALPHELPPPYAENALHGVAAIAAQYDINPLFFKRMSRLAEYEIILILDDSGSMNTPTEGGNTRWSELCEYTRLILTIATVFDTNGIDVHFLNRGSFPNVTHFEQLAGTFAQLPQRTHLTPLVTTLHRVLVQTASTHAHKKRLILIATDGEPTEGVEAFMSALKYRANPAETPVAIRACTDDDRAVGYLGRVDREAPHVDVCDDYYSETKEVLSCQGKQFPFSFGDYTTKCLLGPIDPYFDGLDERRVAPQELDFALTGRVQMT